MKKLGFLILTVFLAVSLFAQMPGNNTADQRRFGKKGEMMKNKLTPQQRAERMAKDLSLTPEQTKKVQALFEDEKTKMEALKAQQKAEAKKLKEERKLLREKKLKEHNDNLEKIIGKEKFDQWQKKQQDKKEKFQERMKNRQNKKMMKKNNWKMRADSLNKVK